METERGRLESDTTLVELHKRGLDDTTRRLEDLETRLADLGDVAARLAPAEQRAAALMDRCDRLTAALGGLDQEIDDLERLERETAERRRLLMDARREQGLYDHLARGFGKQGVQALIIDEALPEIEAAANDLLGRMTNNRMHLTLTTQRETQKGNLRETLDINIADEWGTRAYEMFSGGEAFRINLALRIALSKLLARRAGAPLPTLVIDEGFGSQDAAGRERLLEAISAIQDEFQCLLVVTHIDELKDMFETRIEVTKNGDGSVARVVAA
ncbi:MAG: SMC family ATPase [Dehalococcoidia bacterium]